LQEEISRARLAEHALNGGGGMADMDNFWRKGRIGGPRNLWIFALAIQGSMIWSSIGMGRFRERNQQKCNLISAFRTSLP
jgi:hypothetical protein